MLVEDVDFTSGTPLEFVARKALAVNLSDLAAMGAAPAWAVVALALPEWAVARADELLTAFAGAAREHGIEIVGGDFSRASKLTISVTAIGRIESRPLLRSGAKPGDRIYLSRPIGASAAGLQLIGTEGSGYAEKEFIDAAIRRHLDPVPEIVLGRTLARIPQVTACIDVSDGLSTDLHHLCEASACGAEIEKERLPVFPDLLTFGPKLGIDVRKAVLHGGEEYALLFTSSLRESELSARAGRPVYAIGRMTSEAGKVVLRENGVEQDLEPRGFDHFA
jgi:thiamine-monophosphate kinase